MMSKFEELMEYLSELRKLNEGDYNCHQEIREAIEAIRAELFNKNATVKLNGKTVGEKMTEETFKKMNKKGY